MTYTDETEYAMRNLIELAIREEADLATKEALLAGAEQRLHREQWDFETSDLHDDFSEAYVMAAFARAARAGEERNALRREVDALQAAVGGRQVAVQAICGSILQIAKQGISLVHGGLVAAPSGRRIGVSTVRDVVWQGRNQALHYEDGHFNQGVTQLFAELEASHGQRFSLALHPRKNLAKQVVNLLGWASYDSYLADARALGL